MAILLSNVIPSSIFAAQAKLDNEPPRLGLNPLPLAEEESDGNATASSNQVRPWSAGREQPGRLGAPAGLERIDGGGSSVEEREDFVPTIE